MKNILDKTKISNKAHKLNQVTNDEQNLRKIIIKDGDDQMREGEIIFSFSENGDQYIIYELDNQAFGAKIDENNHLHAIDDDEWPLVEKIYNQYCQENETGKED